MSEAKDVLSFLPDWVTEEMLERVLSHYDDGAFTFDFPSSELLDHKNNTVYHVIPRYAGEGAEDIIHKLRRIMAHELNYPDD